MAMTQINPAPGKTKPSKLEIFSKWMELGLGGANLANMLGGANSPLRNYQKRSEK